MANPTMIRGLVGGTYICAHSTEPPTDEEWNSFLADMEREHRNVRGLFVVTDGGGPNTMQRERVTQFWASRVTPKMAILTPSAVVRGAVTAINWFLGKRLRAFALEDFHGGLDYIEVPPEER